MLVSLLIEGSHQSVLNLWVSNTIGLKSQIRNEPTNATGLSAEAVFSIEVYGVIFKKATSIKCIKVRLYCFTGFPLAFLDSIWVESGTKSFVS